MTERLEQFEAMLAFVQDRQAQTLEKMAALRQQGKEKTATYRQLLGDKLMYQSMLDLYRIHGLVE